MATSLLVVDRAEQPLRRLAFGGSLTPLKRKKASLALALLYCRPGADLLRTVGPESYVGTEAIGTGVGEAWAWAANVAGIGGGGLGGGECWYVVSVLYVVQEKRLFGLSRLEWEC